MTLFDTAVDQSRPAPASAPGTVHQVSRPGSARAKPKRISLALQGGGAFGAFTWGVLDRLLEANVSFDSVSGASAGAMNAVLLASGLARGGADEARASLEQFWRKVSEAGRKSRLLSSSPLLSTMTS